MKSSWARAGLLAGASLLLAAAWASPRAIPYNMDEFVHYHALGCATAPLAREVPLVRDGCFYHDLALPLTRTLLPLRSYAYIGSLPSLPFYPFWRFVRDPVAVRVQGAVFFLLWAWLAARLLRVWPAAVVVASLVFPVLLASFVVDEGPVGLSAILLLVALLAARRGLDAGTRGRAAGWAVLAGLVLFLGVWVKLVFGWWLPAFALFAVAEAARRAPSIGEAARRWGSATVAGSLALVLPTLVLLASVDREGRTYASAFRWSGISAEPEAMESVALRLWGYVVDASLVAPRNILFPRSPLDLLPALLTMGLLALGLSRGARRRRKVAGWAVLAALTYALVAVSGHSRWPHHFAFPLVFLVMALAVALEAVGPRVRLVAAALVLVPWASLASRLPAATIPPASAREKDQLLAFVRAERLDRTTLQVHSSWGTYYIAQLFGDRERMLVYVRSAPDDRAELERLREVAAAHGRPVLLISVRRWGRLQTPAVGEALGRPRRSWPFGSWRALEYDSSFSPGPSPRP
ncbi:MAG TPA: hypothetical protein VMS75_05815 [Terriglobales bacterium]|nr:hypothetical protein [Terriglobales bacterium]